MKTTIIEPSDSAWDDALRHAPHDTYHLAHYVSLEAARTQARPRAVHVQDGAQVLLLPYLLRNCGNLAGGSAFDVVSPYGYPGHVCSEAAKADPSFLRAALGSTIDVWRQQGVCSAFLRLHPLLNADTDELADIACVRTTTPTVLVDLSQSLDAIWMDTNRKRRSLIRKCETQGMVARQVDYHEGLSAFKDIYYETMKRAAASDGYYFDDAYFDAIGKLNEHVRMALVEHEGKVVAATIFLVTKGLAQAHLGGSRTDYLALSPLSLLLHAARGWFKGEGHQHLHLGGGLSGKEDHLLKYKASLSSGRGEFTTVRIIVDPAIYHQLVQQQAEACSVTPETLQASQFFPAYRAELAR